MKNRDVKKDDKGKTGPIAETVKIDGDWEGAIEHALSKKRPEKGWDQRRDGKKHD